MNVAALLTAAAAARPDAAALIEGPADAPRTTTFAQLDARARSIAAMLRHDGLRPGDGVLFFIAPGVELYATLAGVLRAGGVAVFVEPSAGRRVLDAACRLASPRAFVGSAKAQLLRMISPELRRIPLTYVTRGWAPRARLLSRAGEFPADAPDETVDDDAPALLTFTSGSTGAPKGAIRTHGILRAQLAALTRALAAKPGEIELVSLPIVALLNLANGVTSVLPDADLRRPGEVDPEPVLEQVLAHRVTRITASPALLERLADSPDAGRALVSLGAIVTGGGPVPPDMVSRLASAAPTARITAVYGSTEAEPIAHVSHDEVDDVDHEAMASGGGLLAGPIDPAATVRIIPWRGTAAIPPMTVAELDGLAIPAGQPGEIVVTGSHVVRGYLKGIGDAETKFRVDGAVWHRTGDAGYFDERGRLWLLGRASEAVVDSRGTMYPFAVECAVRMRFGVRRLAALGHGGRRVLVVEGGATRPLPGGELVRAELPWAHLDDVVTVRRLPMDRRHNSKIDYPALRKLLDRGE